MAGPKPAAKPVRPIRQGASPGRDGGGQGLRRTAARVSALLPHRVFVRSPVVPVLIAAGVVLLLVLVFCIGVYNRCVNLRTLIENSWSNIDTELKRRHDLIPNLV